MAKLMVQTVLGFAFLLLVLGLALFLSAGSLSFWQAWVYLADFGLCTILITAYLIKNDRGLLERRVRGGPVAETQKNQQIIQSLASLFFVALFIVPGLDYRFHWSHIPTVLSLISFVMVAVGFYIVFLVFRENSFTSATIEISDAQKVISTGPYHLVRHPMYSGAFLLLLFTPLALGSWVSLPLPIPLFLVIIVRLLDEERFLSANLTGYAAYSHQVPYRLVPHLW